MSGARIRRSPIEALIRLFDANTLRVSPSLNRLIISLKFYPLSLPLKRSSLRSLASEPLLQCTSCFEASLNPQTSAVYRREMGKSTMDRLLVAESEE